MIKLGFYITLAIIIALGAVWFVNHPGLIVLTWQGWQVSMPVAVLWLLLLLYTLSCGILFRLYFWIRIDNPLKSPKRLARRREKGLIHLDLGWAAAAICDRETALKHGKKAHNLLPDDHGPLRLLLEVAPETDRDNYLAQLHADPNSQMIALKYQLDQDLRAENITAASNLLEEMQQLAPGNLWISTQYFNILTRRGQWTTAAAKLDKLTKAMNKNTQKHLRAVLCYCQALEADLAGDKSTARSFAKKALKYDQTLLPARRFLNHHPADDKNTLSGGTPIQWQCEACGISQDNYSALCPECHTFGQMRG